MRNLNGRVAVVTGAANGVGFGIAAVLAKEGAGVVVADLDLAAATDAVEKLTGAGRDALALQVDVADRASVGAMIVQVLDHYGRLDIMAANAGIFPAMALEDMKDSDWDRVMDINVKGAVHAIQACISPMRREHYGRIVLTSSITGPIVGAPKLTHYASSKAAMLGLMRSAALEFVDDGVTVNAVQPGNVRTGGDRGIRCGVHRRDGQVDSDAASCRTGRGWLGCPVPRFGGSRLHHWSDDRHRRRPGVARGRHRSGGLN